ncbi:MAG: diphosphomevalonate decarboxylase [Bdellovibrionota bacterium]
MSVTLLARAPSNIALIKYMGKKDSAENLPENSSLSFTLSSLCTYADVEPNQSSPGAPVQWISEIPRVKSERPLIVPTLDEKGVYRVTSHAQRVRALMPKVLPRFGVNCDLEAVSRLGLTLRTANTFPAASGIASSASSFAAVTLGVAMACAANFDEFERAYSNDLRLKRELAKISRKGSGSSCRSFEGPWVQWQNEDIFAVDSDIPKLAHFVILISAESKEISSSRAHELVRSSPLWSGRVVRAESKLLRMRSALMAGDVNTIAQLSWSEAWEMHSLFHTASTPFTYWEPETVAALKWLTPEILNIHPPIVTLDAGPNIHVLVDARDAGSWRQRLFEKFGMNRVLEDQPGGGASVIGVKPL